MKIILINNFFPNGSTGKICSDCYNYYKKKGHSVRVLFGSGYCDSHDCVRLCSEKYRRFQGRLSRVTGLVYGGCYLSTKKAINYIKQEKPDIVHLHCINQNFINVYKILNWLKKNNIFTVLTNHAEFYYTANCGYALSCDRYQVGCGKCPNVKVATKTLFFDNTHRSWKKMKNAFNGFDNVVVTSVSPWGFARSANSTILKDKRQFCVLNGLDTSIFHFREGISRQENMIIHVTASFAPYKDHLKGGYYIVELAKRLRLYGMKIVVVGKYVKNYEYPDNIIFLDIIDDQNKLSELYNRAVLTVIASKKETFSMIVAESLCCGTPVVGFKSGGPESIAVEDYSEFVEFGNEEALFDSVLKFLNGKNDFKTISRVSCAKYAKETMAENYLKVYKEFFKN